ncbi:MAG: Rieske 2Fe-2S domain-containing protein [Myxococcota bacterium]|nr:Rieske 2Fe-2S domain-containing protein [Myxococcota bacterium]
MSEPAPEASARRDFPFPVPDGWFQVSYSDELAAGEARPIHYFGQDLVLFRTEQGHARVLDAHCRHLGAHLGHGGRVEGERLRCPFHAWEYDGQGQCVHIPYAKKIPPRARVRAWPVCERNGQVLAWHHGRDEPPSFEIPEVPEFHSEEWSGFERRDWIVRSCNQELAENTVDQAHFRYLHGTNSVAETEIATDGPRLRVTSRSKVETPRGEASGVIEIQTYGFGFGVTRFKGVVETLVVTTGAPIDRERVHMRLGLSVRKLPTSDATRGVGKAFIAEIERQFEQDISVWENKVHLERPVLCDGDGPIGALRRWSHQFYSTEANEAGD